jgi:uncharacterized protein YqjF (DUF2071 family)
MSFVFLKAQWNKLIMVNYIVEPALLKPYLPKYTELDYYNGNSYVSLVGFMFTNTRILGIKIPYHINFEEVNLRFYVRYNDMGEWKRGVVFIKEIVPKYAIAFVANNFYHEKYVTTKMKHVVQQSGDELIVEYYWKQNAQWNKLGVIAETRAYPMTAGSEEEFIAQHYWGYSKYNKLTTFAYEVRHPSWNVHPVKKYFLDCDFSALYGKRFSFLQHKDPSSVFLADGSEITIFQKKNARPSSV